MLQGHPLITPPRRQRLAGAIALALFAGVAVGAEAPLCPGDPLPPLELPEIDREQADVVVDARSADLSGQDYSVLSGDVKLERADQTLETDLLTVRHEEDFVTAEGDVHYRDRKIELDADDAAMDLANDRADLRGVRYRLRESYGRGEASEARLEGEDRSWLNDVTFTTCPEGNSDWLLTAREMELDHASGRGRARGLGLRFKDVPIFYLPAASFPIDDRRQSGLLYPSIGSSDDDGLDIALPWYWNIAPNQDATLTPRHISDRGAMLETEYRYLTEDSFGEVDVQYMPEDDRLDTHRSYAAWRHVSRFNETWRADIDLKHVSDEAFFEDFGNSLYASSISFLRSRAELSATGDWWTGAFTVDAFETVDREILEQNEPYDRLPRLVFEGTRPLGDSGWQLGLGAEAVAFDRDSGIEGNRVDLYPRLEYPIYRPQGYLLPSLGVRHTAYDLDRADNDSPSRTTPIASVEGGLVFERGTGDGGVQTLEPRVQYLYVPFERQDDLPGFDSSELSFSFTQLFRSNRFSGADRQADANQLSLGVTTRVFESSGRQVLDASLGTIVYFRDQKVQLGSRPEQDASTSPVVGELTWRPIDRWRLALGVVFDPEDDAVDESLLDLRYRGPGGSLFNAAYRRRTDRVRQVDLSFLWPLNDRWSLVGRHNYSMLDDSTLETLLGFEYDSCCWALRMMGRRFVRNQVGDTREGIYLELELKGLGSLGRSTEQVLERAILGYRNRDYR